VSFTLETAVDVSIHIFDARGRLVRTLQNQWMGSGGHNVVWDGRDNVGVGSATGI